MKGLRRFLTACKRLSPLTVDRNLFSVDTNDLSFGNDRSPAAIGKGQLIVKLDPQ
jgi:hypothetical protein